MRSIQGAETPFGKAFFVAVSLIGLGAPYFISAVIIINSDSYRGRGYYHLLFISFAIFIMSITKMAYGEPRMFWHVPDIIPDECTAEYGNPSGHTELAIAYPLFLYLDIFETSSEKKKREERMSLW